MASTWRETSDPAAYLHGLQRRLMTPIPGPRLQQVHKELADRIEAAAHRGLSVPAEEFVLGGSGEAGEITDETATTLFSHAIAEPMGKHLLEVAEAELGTTPAVPFVIGGIPLRSADALILRVPRGGAVVGFTNGLLTFANLLAKLVASAVPYQVDDKAEGFHFQFGRDDILGSVREESDIDERFVDLLAATVGANSPLSARPWLQVGPASHLAAPLRDGIELFVLAGQVVLGILDPSPADPVVTVQLAPGVDVQRVLPSPERIMAADAIALRLLFEVAARCEAPASLYYWGVDAFLSAWGLVEFLQQGLSGAQAEVPLAFLRRDVLRALMKREGGEGAEGLLAMGDTGADLTRVLFDRNQEFIARRIFAHLGAGTDGPRPLAHLPEVQAVLDQVTAGLTGNPEVDVPYLQQQAMSYREHPHAQEIVREIGRRILRLMPPEHERELLEAFEAVRERLQEGLTEAGQRLRGGDLDGAESILRELVPSEGMLASDSEKVCVEFGHPIEALFYQARFREERPPRAILVPFLDVLEMWLRLQVLRRNVAEGHAASDLLKTLNPVSCRARLGAARLRLVAGQGREALDEALEAHSLAYRPDLLAESYCVLGECCRHEQREEAAAACFARSLSFEERADTRSLLNAARVAAGLAGMGSDGIEPIRLLEREGLPPGPNMEWVEIGGLAARRLLADGEIPLALDLFQLVQVLAPTDEMATLIEELRAEQRKGQAGD